MDNLMVKIWHDLITFNLNKTQKLTITLTLWCIEDSHEVDLNDFIIWS